MAARRETSSEEPTEPVAGSLAAELLRALTRLVEYEGSVAAVARIIGVPRQRLRRWFERGVIPPAVLADEKELHRLLWAVYARLAVLDRDQPAQEARDRRMAKNRAAKELLRRFGNARERQRLMNALRGWVKRHDEVARLRGLRESGVQRFASELGVRSELVRSCLQPGGAPSVKLFQAFEEFLAREAAQAEEDEIRRRKMDELMALASVPAQVKRRVQRTRRVKVGGRTERRTVWVDEEFELPVIPKVAQGNWDFSGEGTAGRRWGLPTKQYLVPRLHPSGKDGWAVVEKIVRFALKVPGLTPPTRYPEWNVFALASVYGEEHDGSGQQYRELGTEEDNRQFSVYEAYSGGNRRPPRARERTISSEEPDPKNPGVMRKGFVQRIGEALDGTNLVFLHGAIAWNFRRRTEEEKKRIEKARKTERDFQKTLVEIQARVAEAERKKKAAKQRRAARKQTLEAVLARRAQKKPIPSSHQPAGKKGKKR